MITLKSIRGATVAATYKKGEQVYIKGKVGRLQEVQLGEERLIRAEVEGTSRRASYSVALAHLGKVDMWSSYQCTCPAFMAYPKMCKHCVAVALKMYYEENSRGAGSIAQEGTGTDQAAGGHPAAGGERSMGGEKASQQGLWQRKGGRRQKRR